MPLLLDDLGEIERIDMTVAEDELVTLDESGTVIETLPAGDTGGVLSRAGDTFNTLFGDIVAVIYTKVRGVFQAGFGKDGFLYWGRGAWKAGADGLIGRGPDGTTQVELNTSGQVVGG